MVYLYDIYIYCLYVKMLVVFHSFKAVIANAIFSFPSSNDEKYFYLWTIDISKINYFD